VQVLPLLLLLLLLLLLFSGSQYHFDTSVFMFASPANLRDVVTSLVSTFSMHHR
jgi:hypothetical protein